MIKTVDNTYSDFCENIERYFKDSDDVIVENRNIIKIIKYKNTNYVAKSFKIPHILNRVIYSFFRDSKAKKSYENSLKINNFTPKAICFIIKDRYGLIENSYFISEEFKYDFTIREVLLDKNFDKRDKIFKEFADFTYKLHENSILHLDYSPGNILIKCDSGGYIFKIVDVNRMIFKNLSIRDRVENFSKLWAKDEDMVFILENYMKLLKEDNKRYIHLGLKASQKHKDKKNLKKRLRGKRVVD